MPVAAIEFPVKLAGSPAGTAGKHSKQQVVVATGNLIDHLFEYVGAAAHVNARDHVVGAFLELPGTVQDKQGRRFDRTADVDQVI